MATDFITAGYSAIKALLLADSLLTTGSPKVRAFVWFDGTDPDPRREHKLPSKQPGDLPELKLDWQSLTDSQRTDNPTFGSRQTGSTCPFIETETHEYVITLTVDDTRISTASVLLSHLQRIFRAAPTLDMGGGIVARVVRITIRNEITTRDEAKEHQRRVAKANVSLTLTYDGSTQTT